MYIDGFNKHHDINSFTYCSINNVFERYMLDYIMNDNDKFKYISKIDIYTENDEIYFYKIMTFNNFFALNCFKLLEHNDLNLMIKYAKENNMPGVVKYLNKFIQKN